MVHLMCLGLDGFFYTPSSDGDVCCSFFFLLFPFVPCHVYYQPGWIESLAEWTVYLMGDIFCTLT